MNNYERIKQMSVEELAFYLINFELYEILNDQNPKYNRIKQWLLAECEEE